jgi:site-specific DNA-methyltransferase (adenine-specific)
MQLLNGDCLEIMKTLPDKSIDLFICDLPYGCLTGGGGKEKSKRKAKNSNDVIAGCSWDIKINLELFWIQVKRLMKNDHTPIIHFCNARFGFELYNSNPDWFRYDLVWEKTTAVGFLCANKQPLRSHEMIYVFAKKGANYTRIDIEGDFKGQKMTGIRSGQQVFGGGLSRKDVQQGKRCVKSVIQIANKKGKGQHPTQKPAELYKFLIERYSKEGDTVLDPTFGSGTSLFVANQLGRKAIGIEKDIDFYNKANDSNDK